MHVPFTPSSIAATDLFVWAPKSTSVNLLLYDSFESFRAGTPERELPMLPQPFGYYSFPMNSSGQCEPDQCETGLCDSGQCEQVIVEQSLRDGQLYMFKLSSGRVLPDPRSRWQPYGVHGPSAIVRTDRFEWTDSLWTGVPLRDLVVYELHVGTFNPGQQPYGTFESVIPRLPYLHHLGFTAIELMPIAENPGRNWGYDGVYPFAPESLYGGPSELQKLVNAAHENGLAVVIDCVYNHFGPEGCYLAEFAPYFDDRFNNPWGQAINYFGQDCDPVRDFVVDNAEYWVREYHVDGLRLDATDTIIDLGGKHILADITEAVERAGNAATGNATTGNSVTGSPIGRITFTFAEDDDNNRLKLRSRTEDGYGLDAVWNIDFHHALHSCVTNDRTGYYSDFADCQRLLMKSYSCGWIFDGCYRPSRRRRYGTSSAGLSPLNFVAYAQNHDQVGNYPGSKRLTEILSPASSRLTAALLIMSPFIPMVFMGEEYGERNPFPFFTWFENPALVQAVKRGRQKDMEYMHCRKLPPVLDPFDDQTLEMAKLTWTSDCFSQRTDLFARLLCLRRESAVAGVWFDLEADGPGMNRCEGGRTGGLACQETAAGGTVLVWQWTADNGCGYTMVANLSVESAPVLVGSDWGNLIFSTEEACFGGRREALETVWGCFSSETTGELFGHELIVFEK